MPTSLLTISGSISAAPQGGPFTIGPNTISNATAPDYVVSESLASGDNAIAVPVSAEWCYIQLPSGNSAVVKVRTVIGDTGITLNPNGGICLLQFVPGTIPTIYINAASAISAGVGITFG